MTKQPTPLLEGIWLRWLATDESGDHQLERLEPFSNNSRSGARLDERST